MSNNAIKNSDYEILTPAGFSHFDGVNKKEVNVIFQITFNDTSYIRCTENHLIKISPTDFLEACHLQPGDELVNGKIVSKITYETGSFVVFDPINVELNNEYYSNDIVSHNCAFISNVEDIWISAQQTLATGGGAIILSTPNGTGNFFHKTWVDAETNPNSRFNPIKLHWTVHPERDQIWRDRQDELLGTKGAAQECDCIWGESTVTVKDKLTGEIFNITLKDLYDLDYLTD